jgi:hypothetical protein
MDSYLCMHLVVPCAFPLLRPATKGGLAGVDTGTILGEVGCEVGMIQCHSVGVAIN